MLIENNHLSKWKTIFFIANCCFLQMRFALKTVDLSGGSFPLNALSSLKIDFKL